MAQYIDKSALVAEIERRYETNLIGARSAFRNGKIEVLREVKEFVNTLEVKECSEEYDGFLGKELKMVDDETARLEKLKVKEVDLDKEIDLVEDKYRGFESSSRADIIEIIKNFFELGLRIERGKGMDKVELIRKEIEKRLKGERFLSSDKEYNYLLSFIDSLQEEDAFDDNFDDARVLNELI